MSRLEGKESEPTVGPLSSIVPDNWVKDPEISFVWVQIFTTLLIPWDSFIPALKGALKEVRLDNTVSIAYLKMSGLKLRTLNNFMFAGKDGVTNMHLHMGEKEIPTSNYIALITPFMPDEGNFERIAMMSRLSIASSLIAIHMGHNFLRDIVYSGKVGVNDGSIDGVTQVSSIPLACEGPFLHQNNWDDIEEIASQLYSMTREVRDRLLLGLKFFDKALRQGNDFFNYWTALEVICNGRSGAIKEKIRRCYELSNLQEADNLGFRQIARWRHDYFHKGKEVTLKPDVRRYIQILLLDLLRHEVGIRPRNHLISLVHADGYDLTSIGLSNRRHEE